MASDFWHVLLHQIGGAEIAELDIARPDNIAPDSRGGHRKTGQHETK